MAILIKNKESKIQNEIARQIIVEIIDLTEQVNQSIEQLKPSHIVKMY